MQLGQVAWVMANQYISTCLLACIRIGIGHELDLFISKIDNEVHNLFEQSGLKSSRIQFESSAISIFFHKKNRRKIYKPNDSKLKIKIIRIPNSMSTNNGSGCFLNLTTRCISMNVKLNRPLKLEEFSQYQKIQELTIQEVAVPRYQDGPL